MEAFKALMVGLGEDEDRINAVTQPKVEGTAKDILDYAQFTQWWIGVRRKFTKER